MSQSANKLLTQMISEERIADIDHWILKYPSDQKQSAVMAALMIVQEQHGFLNQELMDAVAEYLDMAPIAVYEVASFYTMYEHKPCGKHLINVCTNISCLLSGSKDVVSHIENRLNIKLGETSSDGQFTLRSVECLGACVHAPMMQVDKDYHLNLTRDKIDEILNQYEQE